MNVVINKQTGAVIKFVSYSSVPQDLLENEEEIKVTDMDMVKNFLNGWVINYDLEKQEFIVNKPPTIEERLKSVEDALLAML